MNEAIDISLIKSASERYYSLLETAETSDFNSTRAVIANEVDVPDWCDETHRYVNRFIQLGRQDLAADYLEKKSRGQEDERVVLERIIDQNNLMGIAFFTRGLHSSSAVCRIVIRNQQSQVIGHGTGFMISPHLLMTNNHVLPTAQSAAFSQAEFDYALGMDGAALDSKLFKLEPSVFFETHSRQKLDFTIVAVESINQSGARLEERGWINLIPESGKAVVGEPLNIIQHPSGEPMQIAIRENKTIKTLDDYFIYSTDTKRGSSGSPVFNDQWQVAALHHAGVPKKDQNGNWLRKDGGVFRQGIDDPISIHWIANEGVRISRIVENMNQRNLPEPKKLLFNEALTRSGSISPVPEQSTNQSIATTTPASQQMSTMGADGIARWNFELTFGPTQQQSAPTQTSTGAMIRNTVPDAVDIVSPISSGSNLIESVFDQRGDYYDELADREVRKKYYADIEDSFEGSSKADRYQILNELITDTHTTIFSYPTARHQHLYPWIDRHEDESLRSIYSNAVMPEELFLEEINRFEFEL